MKSPTKLPVILCTFLNLALFLTKETTSLKHHLVLTDDHRILFSVSSFGYLLGGRLDVIVQNLTLSPDPSEESESEPQFGFVLIKLDQSKNPFVGQIEHNGCMLNTPMSPFAFEMITLSLVPSQKKVLVKCTGDNNKLPSLKPLPYNDREGLDVSHNSYKHVPNKRSAVSPPSYQNDSVSSSSPSPSYLYYRHKPEKEQSGRNFFMKPQKCSKSDDLPLIVTTNEPLRSYSFNFTMQILNLQEEGLYYLTFHNCKGHRGSTYHHTSVRTTTRFNLSMLIYETNFPENYLSAGVMPLPQMYFVLSVMFFLIGSVWINFIARQKDNALKIHYLMSVLVFAKACSLLFHGINYHYIALDGQPVVTWAYLYYATRSVKGALFFITLALIGSGWSFIKHILSDKDKKIILVIVGLQVIAHVAEIVLDESTEGEASNEFWAELCSMVDLFSCVAILYPITWSVRHLEEASRTDGKAAINLKKLEIFKRFYIISTIYIYITRIVTFVFLSMLSYRYSWLAELVSEFSTLIYFIITGYYFQPMPTNPYLLLSSDNDLEEDVLFNLDSYEMGPQSGDGGETLDADRETLMNDGSKQKVHRRLLEEIV